MGAKLGLSHWKNTRVPATGCWGKTRKLRELHNSYSVT